MAIVFFDKNDNLLTLKDLIDLKTKAVIDDAVVTAEIVDGQETQIMAPTAMASLGSGGNYDLVVDKGVALVLKTSYRARVTVVASGGRDAFFDSSLVIKTRDG